MSIKTQGFSDSFTLDAFLNGWLLGGTAVISPRTKAKVPGLDGLTLIINGDTVAFADPASAGLSGKEIKAQIEAAVTGVVVSFYDQRLVLQAEGVTLGGAGTANAKFGFPISTPPADVESIVYNPPDGAAPRWLAISASQFGDSILVVTEVA